MKKELVVKKINAILNVLDGTPNAEMMNILISCLCATIDDAPKPIRPLLIKWSVDFIKMDPEQRKKMAPEELLTL